MTQLQIAKFSIKLGRDIPKDDFDILLPAIRQVIKAELTSTNSGKNRLTIFAEVPYIPGQAPGDFGQGFYSEVPRDFRLIEPDQAIPETHQLVCVVNDISCSKTLEPDWNPLDLFLYIKCHSHSRLEFPNADWL